MEKDSAVEAKKLTEPTPTKEEEQPKSGVVRNKKMNVNNPVATWSDTEALRGFVRLMEHDGVQYNPTGILAIADRIEANLVNILQAKDRIKVLEEQLKAMLSLYPKSESLNMLDDDDLSGSRFCCSNKTPRISDIRTAYAVLGKA